MSVIDKMFLVVVVVFVVIYLEFVFVYLGVSFNIIRMFWGYGECIGVLL